MKRPASMQQYQKPVMLTLSIFHLHIWRWVFFAFLAQWDERWKLWKTTITAQLLLICWSFSWSLRETNAYLKSYYLPWCSMYVITNRKSSAFINEKAIKQCWIGDGGAICHGRKQTDLQWWLKCNGDSILPVSLSIRLNSRLRHLRMK